MGGQDKKWKGESHPTKKDGFPGGAMGRVNPVTNLDQHPRRKKKKTRKYARVLARRHRHYGTELEDKFTFGGGAKREETPAKG